MGYATKFQQLLQRRKTEPNTKWVERVSILKWSFRAPSHNGRLESARSPAPQRGIGDDSVMANNKEWKNVAFWLQQVTLNKECALCMEIAVMLREQTSWY